MTQPVLLLLGPTASGKTALACRMADLFPLEIVSVDSALVYREMNIGTAKPDVETLARYPHRLIDFVSPEAHYSAADFRRDALAAIADIHAKGRIPLLVGGTMMYVHALTAGLSALPAADPAFRASLDARAAGDGWPALHAELARIDPATAARLAPNDSQRIQRALEVYELTGIALSRLQTRDDRQTAAFPYPWQGIALMPSNRMALHARIATRFEHMLGAGFVDEVRDLRHRYRLSPALPSMRCVGYRQIWHFIDGEYDEARMRETALAATRQLAKRQMTWLRSMPRLDVLDCLSDHLAERAAGSIRRLLCDRSPPTR